MSLWILNETESIWRGQGNLCKHTLKLQCTIDCICITTLAIAMRLLYYVLEAIEKVENSTRWWDSNHEPWIACMHTNTPACVHTHTHTHACKSLFHFIRQVLCHSNFSGLVAISKIILVWLSWQCTMLINHKWHVIRFMIIVPRASRLAHTLIANIVRQCLPIIIYPLLCFVVESSGQWQCRADLLTSTWTEARQQIYF